MRRRLDVALATARELDEPDFDLEPLEGALKAAGLAAEALAWDDPRSDFSSAGLTLLRSTWNYPLHLGEFRAWIRATAGVSSLVNAAPIVLWNLHKGYLLELERAGLAIAPTELIARGSRGDVERIARSREWRTLVIKPAVSASSIGTLAVTSDELDRGQVHLDELSARGDALVQEYLPSVTGYGERALVWIDGHLTHAVRKSPRFAGQEERTSSDSVPISGAESDLAGRAITMVSRRFGRPVYARIDLAPGAGNAPVIMELELIEPSLYLAQSDEALDRLVQAIGLLVANEGKGPGAG